MMNCGDSIRVVHPLFHTGGGGSIPTSPLQMRVEEIVFDRAVELNRIWHSRLPRFGNPFATVSFAAEYEGIIYAVAIWSNPVARLLPQIAWQELRRMAIAPDAPKNTGSWMLGVMAKVIKKRYPVVERLVSYQDTEVHAGTIYRAAGWTPTVLTDGQYGKHAQWSNKSRHRRPSQSSARKQRWEKALR